MKRTRDRIPPLSKRNINSGGKATQFGGPACASPQVHGHILDPLNALAEQRQVPVLALDDDAAHALRKGGLDQARQQVIDYLDTVDAATDHSTWEIDIVPQGKMCKCWCPPLPNGDNPDRIHGRVHPVHPTLNLDDAAREHKLYTRSAQHTS